MQSTGAVLCCSAIEESQRESGQPYNSARNKTEKGHLFLEVNGMTETWGKVLGGKDECRKCGLQEEWVEKN